MRFVKAFFLLYVIWMLLGVLSKIMFLVSNSDVIGGVSVFDSFQVITKGVRLDMAIAAYLTVLPSVMLMMGLWMRGQWIVSIWRTYFAIISFVVTLFYFVNIVLYNYWGFPLESTPLLYLKTSPADAFASLSVWQLFFSVFIVIITSVSVFLIFEIILNPRYLFGKMPSKRKGLDICESVVLLLLTSCLIFPIRGGVGTGTNHTGSVYFSNNMRLNHAAVNPVFSFVESVIHKVDIGSQFRFMNKEEADVLFEKMVYTNLRESVESDSLNLRCATRPNVIIIMLESFSKYIMEAGGHVHGVTPRLDALSKEGLYFDRFYANSVRTDRAIVSILSGLPSQPSMSIMDMPNKSTKLPSIARTLGRNGYSTHFYYGGDTNYSNMQSYIVGTGYQKVVSDKSFPSSQITSKWGVHDGIVFDRILRDIDEMDKNTPFLVTLMTLSSHEPFDVPYKSQFADEALNAFAYTDHELGIFIDKLKNSSVWDSTLVVLVPDHLGAYPQNIDNYQLWRYEIPLIMTGGVVDKAQTIHTIGSQNDIAATVLGMLGMNHDDFTFSKDLLDPQSPHFAFLALPDASFGMVTEQNQVFYDGIPKSVVWDQGEKKGENIGRAKAFLQKLYDYIDGL